jgi:diguanylate cyclase (GGDEF)-like protein
MLFIVGCLLNVAGIWIAFTLQYRYDREQAGKQATVSAANLARAFEEHVLRTTQNIDGLLLQLRADYQRDPRNFTERIRFHTQLAYRDLIIQVSVIDARGILVYNDQSMMVQAMDLSDREHFRVHRNSRDDLLFISKPVLGRVSKKWSLQFTRSLANRDGSFGGVIVISVAPNYFSEFFSTIDIGRQGVVTLIGTDRIIRARAPDSNTVEAMGMTLPEHRPSIDPDKPATGVFRAVSAVDGVARIMAYRRIEKYPLVVLVALGEEEVFRAVEARRGVLTLTGGIISFGLFSGLLLILWFERQQQRLTERLTAQEEQLRSTMAELQRLATTDALTGLPNRRYFFERAQAEFVRAQRYDRPLTSIMLDIDYFKTVNDTRGHVVGDAVLQQCALILRECVRAQDVLARYGGEEFVVLLPETNCDGACTIAERVRAGIEAASFAAGFGPVVQITVSIGIAGMESGAAYSDLDKLLQEADAALYRAKHGGRNRISL